MRSISVYAINTCMDSIFKYRRNTYSSDDIAFIQRLIKENPNDSRRALSKKLCMAWNWIQQNGALRDMVCRSFMLELHRAGHVVLPPRKFSPPNNVAKQKKPAEIDIDRSTISVKLSHLKPIEFRQVRRQKQESLCNSLIEQFHYLGYCQPVGEHLKYIVFTDDIPIACMIWSSAPRHIGCRDRFIGWTSEARMKNLHLIAYNSRFLILPWVNVKFLASHLLSRAVRHVARDWLKVYGHRIYYFETFVDTTRFSGACYKAANWIFLGKTTGLGKDNPKKIVNRSIKDVYGYPLSKNFRKILNEEKTSQS